MVIKEFLAHVIVLLWLALGLFIGVQGMLILKIQEERTELRDRAASNDEFPNGIKYDNIIFRNKAELNYYVEIKGVKDQISWGAMVHFPSFLLLILTSCSFGLAGGAVLLIKKKILDKKTTNLSEVILFPLLSLMVGVIVLGIADVLPTLLVEGEGSIRPVTLVFLAFFGGLFVERFYKWTDHKFRAIFKSKEE